MPCDLLQELVDLLFQEGILRDELFVLLLVVIRGASGILQLLILQLHVIFHRCHLVVGRVEISLEAFHCRHQLV